MIKEIIENIKDTRKLPTVSSVKKAISSLKLDFIYPDFFSVEKKNTDAGMGGYNYIYISFDPSAAVSKKRENDVKKVITNLKNKFNLDTTHLKDGYMTIK